MPAGLRDILGEHGAIARRLGERYEFRPQQLEMASAVEQAFAQGQHLLVEAGTGVGKSFAYLLPAIDHAVRNKKRVVISTHTISLQEQLIDKDIPLLRAVYPQEFTAVLVKGRGNYLCQRRLAQARGRQQALFDDQKQLESLWTIEEWANETTDGSLADLPSMPDPGVWDRVCAEQGNCLGKKCEFYEKCFWQAAKRRMQGANILVVNHALFFSDLALRMAGVNYLPKYDVAILDEAHTLEDVAGSHFGLNVTEAGVKYQLRTLYDVRKGKGLLSTHGACANDAIRDIIALHDRVEEFFEGCIHWHETQGTGNGRIRQANIVPNEVSPGLRDLSLHLRAMLPKLSKEEELTEVTSMADKIALLGHTLETVLSQSLDDAVYWMDVAGNSHYKKVGLHAAPINVAEGLRKHLFEQVKSVVMTSATLCTGAAGSTSLSRSTPNLKRGMDGPPVSSSSQVEQPSRRITGASPVRTAPEVEQPSPRITGASPMPTAQNDAELRIRHGAYLPHWTRDASIYAVTFRLADSLPRETLEQWRAERDSIMLRARNEKRDLTAAESSRLEELTSGLIQKYLDAGHGACWLRDDEIARIVADTLSHFDGKKYELFAWSVMPNHVHVVMQTFPGEELSAIVHSWKSFTAHEANRSLGRSGDFWHAEAYDRLIRDSDEFIHAVKYAWSNPEQSGMVDWKWRARFDDRVSRIVNATDEPRTGHGRGARDTTEPLKAPNNAGATGSPHGRGARDTTEPLNIPDHAETTASPHGRGARDTARGLAREDNPPAKTMQKSGDPGAKGAPGPFAYIRSRLGVPEGPTLQLGSPFNYAEQATLIVETELPEPNDTLRFLPAACERILHYLERTQGGAFVLFTSYKMLIDAANALKPQLDALGFPVLVQGQQAPRKVLLERFRSMPNSVLFGTSSFWQGIDVQGDALRNVIIVKLPFSVPDEPVVEARLEAIRRSGGNPFMEYSVPEAIIKLKQGFGRLIRSRSDSGIVVILDSRVKTKRYGKLFLEALPECRTQ